MRYLLVLTLCLFANYLICFGQQELRDPLYLGPLLLDKPNVEAMTKLCEDYHLTEVPSADDFKAFRHSDGTLIKFKVLSDSIVGTLPYIEIYTSDGNRKIKKVLVDTGFDKINGRYERGFHGSRKFSICQIIGNKNKRVVFSKQKGKY